MPAKPPRAARRGVGAGRIAFRAALAAVLLAAAGHALLWLWACDRLEAGFAAWAAARRAEGWRLEHGAPSRGGWPSAATLSVPDFRLRGDAGGALPVEVDWRPEAPLVLRVSPPRLDRLVVEAPGRHRLRLGGDALAFVADRLDAALPIEARGDGSPRVATGTARGLRFDTPAGAAEVDAVSWGFETRANGSPAALRISAVDSALPPGLPGTARLGRVVERIGLDLALTGRAPLYGAYGDPARWAEAWRDGGGALEVQALDARWGEAAVAASATLILDGALQPAGSGTAWVAGGDAVLDAAGEVGLLPPFGAAAARVALRALSRAPEGGGPEVAELVLFLNNRTLSLGGVPLARVPIWRWGAPVDLPPPPRD